LNNLLILDGERLSYRTLDVEQIGSVYEAIMGFNLEVARGPSIAIKPKKAHGAPASINLEKLLATKPADRPKSLKEETDQALTGQALDSLKKATTIDDLLAALEKRIAREVTPNVVSRGAMPLLCTTSANGLCGRTVASSAPPPRLCGLRYEPPSTWLSSTLDAASY
jgi:hypothetical protein